MKHFKLDAPIDPLYCDWCGTKTSSYKRLGLSGVVCCGHKDCREGLIAEEKRNCEQFISAIEETKEST